jgi:hypothetical protein
MFVSANLTGGAFRLALPRLSPPLALGHTNLRVPPRASRGRERAALPHTFVSMVGTRAQPAGSCCVPTAAYRPRSTAEQPAREPTLSSTRRLRATHHQRTRTPVPIPRAARSPLQSVSSARRVPVASPIDPAWLRCLSHFVRACSGRDWDRSARLPTHGRRASRAVGSVARAPPSRTPHTSSRVGRARSRLGSSVRAGRFAIAAHRRSSRLSTQRLPRIRAASRPSTRRVCIRSPLRALAPRVLSPPSFRAHL